MNYPEALIPRLHFKRIETDLSEYWLCRTTPNLDLLQPNSGRLKEIVLFQDNNWEELYDYSTNLPGYFRLTDNFITLQGEERKYFRSYWDFLEAVRIPVFEQDFTVDESKGIFFLPIAAIHRKIQFPLKRPPKLSDDILTAIVVHTPTRSNFWHFSICWEDTQQKIIKPSDSKWKEDCIATMRALLMELIETDVPVVNVIPDNFFHKEV